ncbi:MAG: uroporphyrinogen decarboxylase family protein [Dehalococcoidales bacterium]
MAINVTPVGTDESFQERISRLKTEIEKKHGKTVEQLRDEREKRLKDVIELRVPDRVPVTMQTGVFAARYGGVPVSAMYYDHLAYRDACLKTIVDFEPDTGANLALGTSGLVNELLDVKNQRWPGGTLPPDVAYQFVEGEYMKADEYDHFLADPSDFILRCYLPRLFGTLEPMTKLPPFRNMIGGGGFTAILGFFLRPEFIELAEKLTQAAREQDRLRKEGAGLAEATAQLGFPSQFGRAGMGGGVSLAPFDTISDNLRGMRGAMLDMYRCPDKLLAACDKILEWRISQLVPAKPDPSGNPVRIFMPLHRGSDGFMSLAQFEKFYWPGLKKAILTNIELGYIASPFWEGVWDDRLEYLLDLPRGKVIFHCERTDIFRAKEILGDHMCIQGGVPPTILQAGSPQDVEEYCKKLIKVVGKDGGFILGPGSAIDEAKPANVMAMVESAKKYGWY